MRSVKSTRPPPTEASAGRSCLVMSSSALIGPSPYGPGRVGSVPQFGREHVGDGVLYGIGLVAVVAAEASGDDLAVLLVVDGEGKLALAEGADEDIEQAGLHGLQDSYSVRSSISKSMLSRSDRKKIATPRITSVLYPDTAAIIFPQRVVRGRGAFVDGIEDSRVTSTVADEGEHPEGQDDLDTEGRGVWRLDLG